MPVGVIITLKCAHATNDNTEKCCFPVVWNALSALKLKVNPVLTEVLGWNRQCSHSSHNVVQGCVANVYLSRTMLWHRLGSDTSQKPRLSSQPRASVAPVKTTLLHDFNQTVILSGQIIKNHHGRVNVNRKSSALHLSDRNPPDETEQKWVFVHVCDSTSWKATQPAWHDTARKVRWESRSHLLFFSDDRQHA